MKKPKREETLQEMCRRHGRLMERTGYQHGGYMDCGCALARQIQGKFAAILPPKGEMSLEQLKFGFRYGPGVVTRLHSDKRYGVWFEVIGERERVEVRITHGGRLRISKVKPNPSDYLSGVLRSGRMLLKVAATS